MKPSDHEINVAHGHLVLTEYPSRAEEFKELKESPDGGLGFLGSEEWLDVMDIIARLRKD